MNYSRWGENQEEFSSEHRPCQLAVDFLRLIASFCQLDEGSTCSILVHPHIKVSGKKEDVKEAKEMIMSVLDTKVSIAGQPAGVESARVRIREGTAMLLEHLAGSLASAIPVSTQLDIAAQHHLFMMGRNGSNIKHIMQRTGAQIHFPDPSNPQKKSTVYLQGTIESVCLARQYLMGCLPLVLMFDMKEEIEVDPQFIAQLMEQLDVFISIKPKPKQPSKASPSANGQKEAIPPQADIPYPQLIVSGLKRGCLEAGDNSTDRLLSDPELSAAESPLADKKAPGSERAAERAAAAQQNNERARLAPRPSYVNMQHLSKDSRLLPVGSSVQGPDTVAEPPPVAFRALGQSVPPSWLTSNSPLTLKGSSMSLSRSNSREHLGSGSESDNWRDRNGIGPTRHSEFAASIGSPKRKQNKSTEHYLSSSNYMDCISSLTGSNGCNLNSSFKGSDLPELFSKLGLGKYTDVFQQQEIDLQTFLTLTDQDLKELGITTFGARRKMLLAISVCDSVQIRTKILRAARIV
ncbi:hypothetical protein CB1_001434001 [Camelus ferus]|nr:hypothetical protein CB1_001434001 [Camelus ferus]